LNPSPKQPLVSIITPSYNQARFLEQTIQSVLTQDYPRVEHIIIDGGSDDGSVDVIKKHEGRLAYWESKQDKGQAEAINKGLKRSKGEILAWLNSDDYYLPHTIAKAVDVFQKNPDAVMVYADMLAVNERGETINTLKYRQQSIEDLLCFQIIGQPAVFFRRSAYEKTDGLDLSFHFLLDHHFWLQIAQHGKMIHVPQTWSAARYHPNAKNLAQASEFGHEAFLILNSAASDKALAPILARVDSRARASAYRVNARYLLDGEHPLEALKSWLKAFWYSPTVALSRLNLLISALLNLLGLQAIRKWVLARRARAHQKS
jgi:glycosyltransferase involved in cell wall biosynthesis